MQTSQEEGRPGRAVDGKPQQTWLQRGENHSDNSARSDASENCIAEYFAKFWMDLKLLRCSKEHLKKLKNQGNY